MPDLNFDELARGRRGGDLSPRIRGDPPSRTAHKRWRVLINAAGWSACDHRDPAFAS